MIYTDVTFHILHNVGHTRIYVMTLTSPPRLCFLGARPNQDNLRRNTSYTSFRLETLTEIHSKGLDQYIERRRTGRYNPPAVSMRAGAVIEKYRCTSH